MSNANVENSRSSPGVIRQRESKQGNHDTGLRRWRRFHTRTGWLHLKTTELQTVGKTRRPISADNAETATWGRSKTDWNRVGQVPMHDLRDELR